MHHRAVDITGQRFGFLVALDYAGSDGRKSRWHTRCDCGASRVHDASELRKGRTKSCGCKSAALIAASRRTHGMSDHPAFHVWRDMLARCSRPTHQAWKNYGGRGISVDPAWQSFERFWEDMGPTYTAGLTLDRRDNSAGYAAGNCQWTTMKRQGRNKRNNTLCETPLGRMTVAETAEKSGIGVTTLLYRISAGVSGSALLTQPDVRNRFSIS